MIKIITNDITRLSFSVDAIVNAANSGLLGGGGVDGAIHRAAGPDLLKECMLLNGCRVGEAKITKAYNLEERGVKYIIHAVAPNCNVVWQKSKRAELMANAWRNSLVLAADNNCQSVAFPSLGTGIYANPIKETAKIAIDTITEFQKSNNVVRDVYIVCFCEADASVYETIQQSKTTN